MVVLYYSPLGNYHSIIHSPDSSQHPPQRGAPGKLIWYWRENQVTIPGLGVQKVVKQGAVMGWDGHGFEGQEKYRRRSWDVC